MAEFDDAERRNHCLKAGIELNTLMTHIAGDSAAEVLGVNIKRGRGKITVTVTESASKTYFNPKTDRYLHEILDDIGHNCNGELPVNVSRSGTGYTITQILKKK